MLKIGVLASGRGSNLQSIIDAIEDGYLKEVEIKVVISDNPQVQALQRAKDHGIAASLVNPVDFADKQEFEAAMLAELKAKEVELVVMAGFMRLLSPDFVKQYRNCVMNIHPSLLPAFKGLDAQKQALDYGVKVSVCTVHFADEGMDTGPIILQRTVEVKDDDTEDSLAARILAEEHKAYPEAIRLFSQGRLEVKEGQVYIDQS